MINWQYFPKSDSIPPHLHSVVKIIQQSEDSIKSSSNKLNSNQVLGVLRKSLTDLGFAVEQDKKFSGKIKIPVLFGRNGRLEKYFEADAYCQSTGTVVEIEAGRAVTNYQFLKNLFQACVMHDVHYLAIAVRNKYRTNPDFEKAATFFDTLYASGRMQLPLKGILIIGY